MSRYGLAGLVLLSSACSKGASTSPPKTSVPNAVELCVSKTFPGIPAEAIRDRVWTINGFDQVIEIEATVGPR